MNILYIIFFIFGSINFNSETTDQQRFNEMVKNEDGKCLESVMTQWFDKFNEAQKEGYNMHEADQIGAYYALKKHETGCD